MDRDLISRLAHADHPIAAPLDAESVRALLGQATRPGDRVLDLGCGGGEWLLRALTTHPDLRADGVDLAEPALAHARAAAEALGVADRLTLHRQDATEFKAEHPFDVVLSVGAAHVFGGLLPTLAAVREHLAPGGRASTVDSVVADGWTPVGGHVSTRRELDDYEWAWTGSLASWALDRPDDPDGREALTVATAHRSEWLRTYRDTWGFLCLVLRRTDDRTDNRGVTG